MPQSSALNLESATLSDLNEYIKPLSPAAIVSSPLKVIP
jgi:hypothetical protein